MTHDDRRAAPRYIVDLPARFWTDDRSAEQVHGRIRDVSWGGLFLECEQTQPPGTPVQLLVGLTRPDATVPIQGRVAWAGEDPAKGTGMGIRLETPL
jgi:hypothetical protein